MSHREQLLDELLVEVESSIRGKIGYGELAQRIWNAASAMTAQDDLNFRDYLQWFEGNLDMLINLEGSHVAINTFLVDQMDLLKMSLKDENMLTSLPWKEALAYISSTSKSGQPRS